MDSSTSSSALLTNVSTTFQSLINSSGLDYSDDVLPLASEMINNVSRESLSVMPFYPPTQEPSMRRLMITMYLIVCLTIGICGNFSQLALQYYSYRLRIYNTTASPNFTQLYICFLHVVYFFISVSLPSVIIEHLVNIWMFGIFTCASHLFLVIIGRTAAAWFTVMLFVDQLRIGKIPDANVIRFKKFTTRKLTLHVTNHKKAYYSSLIFVGMICVVSSVPSLIYIELTQDILYEEYVDQMILKIRTFKCSSKIPEKLSLAISIFNFIVDFFVPLVIIIVISIVIFCQSRRTSTSVIYQKKLQSLRLLVALLYFVAYAAHWFAVARVFIGVPTPEESVLFGDFAILFPYTLPAIIWLPLSFLSSVAAAQARFYDVSISSRTIDGNSDPTSTARFAKQKREKRWSASDVLTKLERNGQPGKSDISTVVSENVSNISNTLLVINKEYRSCADQEVLEISENTFREQYLKVP